MARPQTNKVSYFPHPVTHGKKMSYIEKKHGNNGYATWFKILEELGNTDYHYLNLSDEIQIMFLSDRCLVSESELICIINDLVKLGEFDKELWTENSILFSEKFLESVSDAYNKRSNECIDKESLLLLLIRLGIRKPPKSDHKPLKSENNTHINPQSKVKYNKEEYNKEESFDIFWSKYPNKLKKKNAKEKFIKLPIKNIETILNTIDGFAKYKPFESYSHPMAISYLNAERWNDEIAIKKEEQKSSEYDFLKQYQKK